MFKIVDSDGNFVSGNYNNYFAALDEMESLALKYDMLLKIEKVEPESHWLVSGEEGHDKEG